MSEEKYGVDAVNAKDQEIMQKFRALAKLCFSRYITMHPRMNETERKTLARTYARMCDLP
jgi:hypothetical protein